MPQSQERRRPASDLESAPASVASVSLVDEAEQATSARPAVRRRTGSRRSASKRRQGSRRWVCYEEPSEILTHDPRAHRQQSKTD